MKKIAIILPKLTTGGTERTAAELANYLSGEGLDVTIVLMFKEEIFFKVDKNVKIAEPLDIRKSVGKFLYIPYLLFFLRKNVKQNQYDSVLCLGYILLSLLATIGLSSRVIISGRSSPNRIRFPRNPFANTIHKFSHKLVSGRVDGIIAQTNYAKEVYQKKYNCPIQVIPNFLREIKEYDHERENQIITLGRCSYEKGQHFLIEAFSKLNAPNWKLVIVGDGPLLGKLKNQANELNITEQVEFSGFQKEVDFYLSQAKVFGFTSIIEGYPNALIEGMANGLVPVSFDCSAGPSDIINDGENGFLVPVGDVGMFAEKLQLLINDDNLIIRMSEKAKKIKETNDLDFIANNYKNFLLN